MPRTVEVGGMSKRDLLAALGRNGVKLNEAAQTLFAHEGFATSEATHAVEILEVTVADLGYADGATIDQIFGRAAEFGLTLCPLELGPQLRLQYLRQAEGSLGQRPSRHRAPPGSITIASRPLTDDEEVPKGFYLRRIDGVPWLRGYRSGRDHVWSPDDHFVFCRAQNAAEPLAQAVRQRQAVVARSALVSGNERSPCLQ